MQRTYTVLYEEGPTSWGAYVPDIEGCFAVGQTREEAEARMKEALQAHIDLLHADGDPIPEANHKAGEVTVNVPTYAEVVAA